MAPPERRYGALVGDRFISRGRTVLHPALANWFETAAAARADGFDQLVVLTAVDYSGYGADRCLPEGIVGERYEVVAELLNHTNGERIRLRVQVPAAEPVVPTLFDLWPGAENPEREVYDMFGIAFSGHPDPTRILMPEDWTGTSSAQGLCRRQDSRAVFLSGCGCPVKDVCMRCVVLRCVVLVLSGQRRVCLTPVRITCCLWVPLFWV